MSNQLAVDFQETITGRGINLYATANAIFDAGIVDFPRLTQGAHKTQKHADRCGSDHHYIQQTIIKERLGGDAESAAKKTTIGHTQFNQSFALRRAAIQP